MQILITKQNLKETKTFKSRTEFVSDKLNITGTSWIEKDSLNFYIQELNINPLIFPNRPILDGYHKFMSSRDGLQLIRLLIDELASNAIESFSNVKIHIEFKPMFTNHLMTCRTDVNVMQRYIHVIEYSESETNKFYTDKLDEDTELIKRAKSL